MQQVCVTEQQVAKDLVVGYRLRMNKQCHIQQWIQRYVRGENMDQ